jgi:uncharacterized protein YPO0396
MTCWIAAYIMTEELAYHLKQATQALGNTQRDIKTLRTTLKEKESQLKSLGFKVSALWHFCRKYAPKEVDLQTEVSKEAKAIEFSHMLNETHKINIFRPLTPDEEVKVWEAIETQARANIQRLKEKSDTTT